MKSKKIDWKLSPQDKKTEDRLRWLESKFWELRDENIELKRRLRRLEFPPDCGDGYVL